MSGWVVTQDHLGFREIHNADDGDLIAEVFGDGHDNAHKIAAAPDLYEALDEAEKHFGPFAEITINGHHDSDDVRVVGLIRAAIAKARGDA